MHLLVLALTGCWNIPDDADFSVVPFTNEYAGSAGVVETVETTLECPDGGSASFYVVYPEDQPGPQPVALVLHSSAFDYVLRPDIDNPLAGNHWQGTGVGGVTRMERGWGVQKVWETIGMHPQVDPVENNLGTLAAALLDEGIVGIYPGNCWGDLWHNEQGYLPNDLATEYVDRNGGAFAWRSLMWMYDEQLAATYEISTGALIDTDTVYLVGLGDGARGVTELLLRDGRPDITGMLLDAPIDNLQTWSEEVSGVKDGLERIYYDPSAEDEATDYNLWSLKRQVNRDEVEGIRVGLVHSRLDPQVPAGSLDNLFNAIEGRDGFCVHDTDQQAHVFTNSDTPLARDMVAWMTQGDRSRCDGEDGSGSDTGGGDSGGDTGS